jgi:ABC-type multidrug transport system ATPase subunit
VCVIKTAQDEKKEEYELPEQITFVNKDPECFHDLPSPYLLKVHAALCRVLHMSGSAAEYVEEIMEEFDQIGDSKTLAAFSN